MQLTQKTTLHDRLPRLLKVIKFYGTLSVTVFCRGRDYLSLPHAIIHSL